MNIDRIATGPLAHSLSGGGSKCWNLGAFQALNEAYDVLPRTKIVIGTSTGALMAAIIGYAAATGDESHLMDLIHIYSNVTTRHILEPHSQMFEQIGGMKGALLASILFNKPSVYDISPLVKLVDEFMTPRRFVKIISSDVEVGFCCTNMTTGQTELFTSKTHPTPHVLKKALIASAAQPVFMGMTDIDGDKYADGGLADFQPVRFVKDMHLYTPDMTVVALSNGKLAAPGTSSKLDTVVDQLERALEILVENVYRHNREAMCEESIIWLEPEKPIGGDALRFLPAIMQARIKQGYRDVMNTMRGTV